MILVHDFHELLTSIALIRDLRNGFLTNFYPDEKKHSVWIKNHVLYSERLGDTLFFLKKGDGFWNLFYCSPDLNKLKEALLEIEKRIEGAILVDIVGKRKQCKEIESVFLESNFSAYCLLMRMSRMTPRECIWEQKPFIHSALSNEAGKILALLQKYFDPKAEQIPFLDEVLFYIEQGHVLVCREGNKIVGFLIYELTKSTLYLRYWFVDPEYRNKGIGSALMNSFFKAGQETMRQLFWVICDNENAIKRYRHYGFDDEDLYDQVLIFK